MKILENGVVRDATPEELAQAEVDKLAAATYVETEPTKEELLAELQALAAKIQALE
jgi:hypothetical protein